MHTLSHIFARFGSVRLDCFDKVELQAWLNQSAKFLVLYAKFYLKSILAEDQDQAYLVWSPVNELESRGQNRLAMTF